MVLEIREHINLQGDDPLDATAARTHYKASYALDGSVSANR